MDLGEQSLSSVTAVPKARCAELQILERNLAKLARTTGTFQCSTHEEARRKKHFWRLFKAIIFLARYATA